MPEEFEYQDLREAVFWDVDLRGATFRDVDLSGARISHARLVDVVIDGEVDRLVVNGVDVTDHVNEHDEWFPLRSQLRPADPAAMRRGWELTCDAWERVIDRAGDLPDGQRRASVEGEWSFVDTLRHLVFATDKWFTVPVLGGAFEPLGLPNTGSRDFGWPGLDPAADPTFDAAVAAWRDRASSLRDRLATLQPTDLGVKVEVLENGASTVAECVRVVFEEHFHHLRYATRDLDHLDGAAR